MAGSSGERGGAASVLPASWRVHVASAIGASHVRDGLPNQDAAAGTLVELPGGVSVTVAAVADGHGDARHFRSDRGSQFAVSEGLAAVAQWVQDQLPATPAEAGERARALLVPDVVARWDAAVAADIASDPLQAERADGHQLTSIAYGSTLMITVISDDWAVLAQIGDGDMLAVLPDGQAMSPVPTDPNLDGRRTTSLCQVGAVDSFRVATIDLTDSELFAVLSGTDGFGNAQADEQWQRGVAADLVRFTIDSGQDWISGSLPGWAKQCASSAGSGDDCTVALVVNSGVELTPPAYLPPVNPSDVTGLAKTVRLASATIPLDAAADGAALAGSEGITVPVPRSDPANGPLGGSGPSESAPQGSWFSDEPPTQRVPPHGPPPGAPPGPQPPARPARPRSRVPLLAAGAVVVVVAIVVGIALAMHHSPAKPGHAGHSTTPNPSATGPSTSPKPKHHHGHGTGSGGGVGGGQGTGAAPTPSSSKKKSGFSFTFTAQPQRVPS
jgi:hypothetical protein